MNLEFFKWYNIDLFANFTGKKDFYLKRKKEKKPIFLFYKR
jgi:hypothetical protein